MIEMNSEDPRIGTVLNARYKIIERIGAGGMAVVYRGERLELGRPVAIKFLQEVMLQYPKFIGRFEAEAKAMSKLTHPYCVSVIDFGVEGAPYIVMDFVKGKTLKALLKEERISVPRAISLARQILAGISHAHAHGIIHRDMKPENVMLSEAVGMGEHVRIFDFGLAKLLDGGGIKLSSPSIIAGTPNYMASEQSRGKVVDERADLYSIGIILFEMLAGEKPFISDDFVEVVRMHRDAPRPSLTERTDDQSFSPELEELIAKAMARNPRHRFQTADEMVKALNATPEGSETKEVGPTEADTSASTIGKTFSEVPTMYMESGSMLLNLKRRLKTNRIALPALGLALLVALVGGYTLFSNTDGDEALSREKPSSAVKRTAAAESGGTKGPAKKTRETEKNGKTPVKQVAPPETGNKAGSSEDKGADDASPVRTETPVRSIKDVRILIDEGRTDEAINGLRKLRKDTPKNAYIVLLLANLFFEKTWWGDALEHYRAAVRMSPAYRSRQDVNKNLIAMLGGKKIYRKAAMVIQNDLGRHALPHLRRAAKRDKSPMIRKRAGQLVKKISR